jgi:hypothetical protein
MPHTPDSFVMHRSKEVENHIIAHAPDFFVLLRSKVDGIKEVSHDPDSFVLLRSKEEENHINVTRACLAQEQGGVVSEQRHS